MKLIDSNILIYSGEAQFAHLLLPYVTDASNAVSAVSLVETLGYHKITLPQMEYFENIFQVLQVVQVDFATIRKAIEVRQMKKISLGDALVAATALLLNLELVSRNTDDFRGIPGLTVINPMP
jgi:toxin FitB